MKKLQNNYTTPEQSKRLLELGVPADSADCIIFDESEDVFSFKKYHHMVIELPAYEFHKQSMISGRLGYLPCWSVGRLMEIYDICVMNSTGSWADYTTRLNYVNYLVSCFEISDFDFSKLEEEK